jgi:signal transduction histidine kinase
MEKMNVLMVDDQPAKLLSYEAILGELGENLIKANSGKEALEHLLNTEIAVVLLDVRMPELGGFEVAEMIRSHPRFQKTAIIFISAESLTDTDKLDGYRRGAVDYISVPISPEILRAKVGVFAQLHRQSRLLDKLNSELRDLSSQLITLQDDERRRVSRELHEGLGQDLAATKMMIDRMNLRSRSTEANEQALSQMSTLMDSVLQRVRSMSYLLHPPTLDEVGLYSAVRWYIGELTKRSGGQTTLDVKPTDFPRLRPELETAIFRIVQEALNNVFGRSGARQISVTLTCEHSQIAVMVSDNGTDASDDRLPCNHEGAWIGIGEMRQRAADLGGELRLQNTNPGAFIQVIIPYQ